MPYKCLQCDKVVYSKEDLECGCRIPQFQKCETVHLLHRLGTGKLLANRKIKLTKPDGSYEVVVESLRLCCTDTTPMPIATGHIPSVTCQDCLTALDLLREMQSDISKETQLELDFTGASNAPSQTPT